MFNSRYILILSVALVSLSLVIAAPNPPVTDKGSTSDASKSEKAPVLNSVLSIKGMPPKTPPLKATLPSKSVLPIKVENKNACQCYVPAIYSPVCGSDKKIYANKYLLECENLCSKKDLKVIRDGKC